MGKGWTLTILHQKRPPVLSWVGGEMGGEGEKEEEE